MYKEMIVVGDTNKRIVVYPIIVLVILCGFYLRVSNVFDQVPWDGEDFMAGRILESKDIVINNSFPGVSKPLWQLMVAFGYRVMGFRLFVGSLWAVYFGTAIIALIYKLCQRLFNSDVGFYAALFTASMLTFIHVSRLPRAPMASLFFMLFAVNLYLKFAKKGWIRVREMFLVGVAAGFTITLHSMYFIPSYLILGLWELLREIRLSSDIPTKIIRVFRGVSVLTVAMFIPVSVAEIVVRVSRMYGITAASWMGGAFLQMFDPFPPAKYISDYFSYIETFVFTDGLLVAVLFLISFIVSLLQLKRTSSSSIFRALTLFLVPLVLLELSIPTKGLALKKYYIIFMAGVPVLIGYSIGMIVSRLRFSTTHMFTGTALRSVLVVVVLGWGYLRAQPRIEWTSGIDQTYNIATKLDYEYIYYAMELGDFYFSTENNAHLFTSEVSKTLLPTGKNIIISTVTGSCDCSMSDKICSEDIRKFRHVDKDKLKVIDLVQGYGPSLQGPIRPYRCHVLYRY